MITRFAASSGPDIFVGLTLVSKRDYSPSTFAQERLLDHRVPGSEDGFEVFFADVNRTGGRPHPAPDFSLF
jgi:hypothetical protein